MTDAIWPLAAPMPANEYELPVRPRYLAGGGGCADAALDPLTVPTWRFREAEPGNVHAFADRDRAYVGFLPEPCQEVRARGLWHIEARQARWAAPVWEAAMSDHTPPELVAAFTAALAQDAALGGEEPPYLHRDDHPDVVWEPLRRAGWDVHVAGFAVRALAPGLLVHVGYTPPRPESGPRMQLAREEAWEIEVRPSPAGAALWWAYFHAATPAHLIGAFTTALSDPAPLWREEHQIPRQARPRVATTD
ncbi:DUF317 domain-containing protein [Streptomyces sp. NPDC086554]|uniref:DUF317 domain-containing protein n=1 Tax=Streptomyces sp. NPDC086554 TaxID=3154864 RepID=UPI0034296B3E